MARELEERCAICLESWEEASYVMPCLHQFCYPCILQWAESKPECPLCKRRILSIVHSVRADDDFEEHVITAPAEPQGGIQQLGAAPGHPAAAHRPGAADRQPVATVPRAPLGGLQPSTWASLFRDHPALLQLLRPWLRQELGRIFGSRRPLADVVEDLVVPLLVLFGLDEELLVQLLGASLQNRAATFVQQLINVAVQRCSGEAHRLLGLQDPHAAGDPEGSPGRGPAPAASQSCSSAPGTAPSSSSPVPPGSHQQEERPGTSSAALHQGPPRRSPSSAPIPTHREQEEPQEDLERDVAAPSTSRRDRDRSTRAAQRAPKRRAGSSPDSAQSPKRPARH